MSSRPIHVTGAHGYLGGRIMEYCAKHSIPVRAVRIPPLHGRIKAMLPEDAVVIHCAALVPHSQDEANEYTAAMGEKSCGLLRQLLEARPAFVVFPSTRETEGVYAEWKQTAEAILQRNHARHVILRFPGLFGPPRRDGLVYKATRYVLIGEPVNPPEWRPAHNWTTMHVMSAAEICVEAALAQKTRKEPRICCDPLIEEFLRFVRSE